MRVLFVCTGNICRSPSAQAVLEARAAREGVGVRVDSAGLGDWHAGELPDSRARAEGARRGYRMDHRARVVTAEDFDAFDLLVAMDRGHERALRARAPAGRAGRVVLFRALEPTPSADLDVADPYYDGPEAFVAMFETIEAGMPALLARLRGG